MMTMMTMTVTSGECEEEGEAERDWRDDCEEEGGSSGDEVEEEEEEGREEDDDDWMEGEGGKKKSRRDMLRLSPAVFVSFTQYFSFSDLFSISIVPSQFSTFRSLSISTHSIITYPPSGASQLVSNVACFTSKVFVVPVEETNNPPPD